ncbi:MAG: hypothetical protein COC15_05105, partial [Legionellales bacterium]
VKYSSVYEYILKCLQKIVYSKAADEKIFYKTEEQPMIKSENKQDTSDKDLSLQNSNISDAINSEKKISEDIIQSLIPMIPKEKMLTYFINLVKKDDIKSAKLIKECSKHILTDSNVLDIALQLQNTHSNSSTYKWLIKDIKQLQEQLELLSALTAVINNNNSAAIKFIIPKDNKFISIMNKVWCDTKNIDNDARKIFVTQYKKLYPKNNLSMFNSKKEKVVDIESTSKKICNNTI